MTANSESRSARFTRRRKGLLFGFLAIGFLAVAALGVRELVQRYPNQGFLSAERLNDAMLILLGTDVRLERYQPEPVLRVEREQVTRASYPAIDVHWHLESQSAELSVERLVAAMDGAGIQRIVHLGGLPVEFKKAAAYTAQHPDRFVLFVKPDFAAAVSDARGLEAGIADQVKWMEEAARLGAQGVKISKSLGMGQRTRDGRLLAVDDPRLDPIWETAGKLGLPVLIHTGDAEAFFRKPDGHNERYEEMLRNPKWVRYGKEPSLGELFAQRERLLARHPRTNFIGAHFGMQEDDLTQVAALLDRFPNYYVDTAAVAHALGRQPVTARAFFLRYQDRILYGSDGGYGLVADGPGWTPQRLFRSYIEFFETSNEYIEYPLWGSYNQGRWRIYGLDLPGEVLEKIYALNAARLIPSREDVARRLTGG
jgi:predicted TIM-barrel fold metal-dependent hydrolase